MRSPSRFQVAYLNVKGCLFGGIIVGSKLVYSKQSEELGGGEGFLHRAFSLTVSLEEYPSPRKIL